MSLCFSSKRRGTKNILFGTFYRPPNSSNEILEKNRYSFDLALVITTGDFNLNFLDSASRNKLLSIVNQCSLCQIIEEPTHFTETSSSITDLFFTRNPDNVIVSRVGEAFLDQNIRYHCPVYAVFNFDKPKHHCYKRKYGNMITATINASSNLYTILICNA